MHICIDARLFGIKHAGIGRYTQNLVSELMKQNPSDRFTLITQEIPHYSLAEQLRLPRILNQVQADLYHFPHFNVPFLFRRPFVVTIHDLLWHELKDPAATTLSPLKHKLKYFGYGHIVKHAVFSSRAIIVPSKYVQTQVQKFYPQVSSSKIHVIYEGVDPKLLVTNHHLPATNHYLLYVGSLYPHKNLAFVIQALKGKYLLKIVSARSVFQDHLKQQVSQWGLADAVEFLGAMSDAKLAIVISQAQALIQPSLFEGFGLPGLEAMSLGTPVLASNAGSLPEIYGKAALYFDPKDSQNFLKVITLLPQKRAQLIAAGKTQVQKYSWSKAAQSTLKVYENCLGV